MLIIRCSCCKTKLWRYLKIGKGEVIRCHKKRITKIFNEVIKRENEIFCPRCNTKIGRDMGTFYKMIGKNFIYTGTKD